MKIQQNSLYSSQYVENNSKSSKGKSNLFENQIRKSDDSDDASHEDSVRNSGKVSHKKHIIENFYTFRNNYTAPPNVKPINDEDIQKDEVKSQAETEDMLNKLGELHEEKIADLNSKLLDKFNIDGTVSSSSMQTVPQNYTIYYIQTTDNNEQNKVIIELENGEFLIGDTSLDYDKIYLYLDQFSDLNSFNSMKFDVDKLKDLFVEFLDSLENTSLR